MFSRPIIEKCRSKILQIAPVEHSAILLTCTKLPPVFKTFVLSIFECLLKTGFTDYNFSSCPIGMANRRQNILINRASPIILSSFLLLIISPESYVCCIYSSALDFITEANIMNLDQSAHSFWSSLIWLNMQDKFHAQLSCA